MTGNTCYNNKCCRRNEYLGGMDFNKHIFRRKVKKSVMFSAALMFRAVRTAEKHLNDIYISAAGVALGMSVFFICSIYAAAERGMNGCIGGELIAGAATVFLVNLLWKYIKKHLKD